MSIRKKIKRSLRSATFLTALTGSISFGIRKTIDIMYSETINHGIPQIEQQHLIGKCLEKKLHSLRMKYKRIRETRSKRFV